MFFLYFLKMQNMDLGQFNIKLTWTYAHVILVYYSHIRTRKWEGNENALILLKPVLYVLDIVTINMYKSHVT